MTKKVKKVEVASSISIQSALAPPLADNLGYPGPLRTPGMQLEMSAGSIVGPPGWRTLGAVSGSHPEKHATAE